MRVITCSRYFPRGHIHAGQPTYFVEKIWKSIWDSYQGSSNPLYPWWENYDQAFPVSSDLKENIHQHEPKHTTIRFGNHWKAGDMASLRVWSGKPRRSKQIEFAQVEVKSTQIFEVKVKYNELIWCIDGDDRELFAIGSTGLEVIANNDGLSIEDFISWFSIHPKSKGVEFSGQILTWDENLVY